ncbi:MAG: hypothetical protein AAF502_01440 [Bacteroidota bacterium]
MPFDKILEKYKTEGKTLQDRIDSEKNYPKLKQTLKSKIANQKIVHSDFLVGILDEDTPKDILIKVYKNMMEYAKTNWNYKADSNHGYVAVAEGQGDEVMCETVANAFKYIYESCLRDHIFAEVPYIAKSMKVDISRKYMNTVFLTNENLALLGKNRGYNVVREINAKSGKEKSIKRHMYFGHWQIEIHGVTYDSLYNLDPDNIIEHELVKVRDGDFPNMYKAKGDENIVMIRDEFAGPVSTGEFNSHYIYVTDYQSYKKAKATYPPIDGIAEKLQKIEKEATEMQKLEAKSIKNQAWTTEKETMAKEWQKIANDLIDEAINYSPKNEFSDALENLSYIQGSSNKLDLWNILKNLATAIKLMIEQSKDFKERTKKLKSILRQINQIKKFDLYDG